MQDRFKFRAYDKDNKIMLVDTMTNEQWQKARDLYSYNEWLSCIELGLLTALDYFDDKNFILMQCTGLKDKNGKLIYEGDIVDILSEVEAIGVIKWQDDLARFIIVYENVQCDFDNYRSYELEVIGNIYENPELLESEQA